MADSKITALTAISTVDPTADPLVIVDVSDTSMAASGTTKKSTINQLLGAGGTATLASATITGDLTVATNGLKVDSANKNVGINTATPTNTAGYKTLEIVGTGVNTAGMLRFKSSNTSVNTLDFADSNGRAIFAISNHPVRFGCNDIEQYRINPLGVFSWFDGLGGTRMTLDSTGLGVGVTPITQARLSLKSSAGSPLNLVLQNRDASQNWQFYVDGVVVGDGILTINNGTSSVMQMTPTGNVGIGVTPSAWASYKALQVGSIGSLSSITGATIVGNNWFYDGASKYITTAASTIYEQGAGTHAWYSAASGTAGTAVSFGSAKMTLNADGNLILLSSNTPATLTTNGQLTVNATSNTNLRFSYRGSDGVTRVANITLA